MQTPIKAFVQQYIASEMTRFHMPGHKGHVFFGCEPYDITEIKGADVLHHGDGIIKESEKNASRLFGSGLTCYSTEGSTLCIKSMLAILCMENGKSREGAYILAARNVHRSVVDACALLDLDIHFLPAGVQTGLCSCVVGREELERALVREKRRPLGVYITSPDYLGQLSDVASLSEVCRKWELPLLVDNAHGAYLHFLREPVHPMDLGAAMCSDSAHKTLPALTGAAYLHIHPDYVSRFAPYAEQALSLFGSTSPSYLLLQSLDLCNAYLEKEYPKALQELTAAMAQRKKAYAEAGIPIADTEPLKIVIHAGRKDCSGEEIAQELRGFGIECEYADTESVVLMAAPENTEKDWKRLDAWAANSVLRKRRERPVLGKKLVTDGRERALTIREAVFSPSEEIPVSEAEGRICAAQTVACPPAIPIAVSGERINREMIRQFQAYEIERIAVVCRNRESGS